MKKYTVSVPVNCMNLDALGKEKILKMLKNLDATRVFLNFEESVDSGEVYFSDKGKHLKQIDNLRSASEFFKAQGFEVTAWFWAFKLDTELNFTTMCDFNGKKIDSFACPTDEEFLNFATETVRDIASCGVDMIVFNDDFRYGYFSNEQVCLCDNHIKLICEEVGENLTRAEIKEKIQNGEKNKYRDAYLKVNKESLLKFATKMRNAIDTIDSSIRIGFCVAMTAWDIDGDAYDIAKAFAGDTRPFIRLIGAPYWAADKLWNNRLQDVIELNRMEKSYFENNDIELIAEGDVWPRPRTKCPASLLEGYDTAIRATQSLDGILKIALDYTSDPDYETGYIDFHIRNKPLYRKIKSAFCGKKSVGVRVYENAKKLENMKNPNELCEKYKPESLFFSEAARTLTCNGIPTVYEGDTSVGIAFGENARNLPIESLKNGMIIDTAAACILSQRGIDVGIKTFGEKVNVINEVFIDSKNKIIAYNSPSYKLELNPSAKVLSIGNTNSKPVPMSFTYTNENGERFLVINTNPRESDTLMRHYARGCQYKDFISNSFYATCKGNPDLYILCSIGDGEFAVGVWNFCIDAALNPVVSLGKKYSNIRFINGNGKLNGDNVELEEIPAYGFSGFVLS